MLTHINGEYKLESAKYIGILVFIILYRELNFLCYWYNTSNNDYTYCTYVFLCICIFGHIQVLYVKASLAMLYYEKIGCVVFMPFKKKKIMYVMFYKKLVYFICNNLLQILLCITNLCHFFGWLIIFVYLVIAVSLLCM